MRHIALITALAALPAMATEYPLWDREETIAEYAKRAELEPTKTIDLGGGVTMEFVLIPAGKFVMGTPEPKPVDEVRFMAQIQMAVIVAGLSVGVLLVMLVLMLGRSIREKHRPQVSLAQFLILAIVASTGLLGGLHWYSTERTLAEEQGDYVAALARFRASWSSEKPAHDVTFSRPFYMGRYEVTQEQYQAVVNANPSGTRGLSHLPVDRVSWKDSRAFCDAVKITEEHMRLPSEAEWEYACRAGTRTTYHSGDYVTDLSEVAWYAANSGMKTHPVGRKKPNAWGLYDMHGNVGEFVEDDYHPDYMGAPVDGSAWIDQPRHLILIIFRGGSSLNGEIDTRCFYRDSVRPFKSYNCVGFRVVLDPKP